MPSGLWAAEEYEKLPPYDRPTADQPALLFLCHQVDGHICAGWAGCHDMDESLAVRVAGIDGGLSLQDVAALRAYATDIDLFPTGQAAAEHGLVDVGDPSPEAVRAARKLAARREILRPS